MVDCPICFLPLHLMQEGASLQVVVVRWSAMDVSFQLFLKLRSEVRRKEKQAYAHSVGRHRHVHQKRTLKDEKVSLKLVMPLQSTTMQHSIPNGSMVFQEIW